MENIIQILLISIIQGIAEFIPVSSSAHINLLSNLFNYEKIELAINVSAHFGSLVAVLFYFNKEIYKKIDFPIVSTSANISGGKNLFNISDIIDEFEESLDFIVDYGDIGYSKGSTILNVNKDGLNLIRDGDIQFETIIKELNYGKS